MNNPNQFIVSDLHIDLYNSIRHFDHTKYDFQILAEYVDPHNYIVIIRRLDQNSGWNINLQVLACDFRPGREQMHKIIDVGPTDLAEMTIPISTELEIFPDITPLTRLPRYQTITAPEPIAITRSQFNEIFDTDIVVLPAMMYAFGLKDNTFYMYNEYYGYYNELIHQIKHLISVLLTKKPQTTKPWYFILWGGDGYLEGNYHSATRTIPKIIGEIEHQNNPQFTLDDPNEYAVFHKNKYVLTQSQPLNLPFAYGIPDRHYLMCNLYNPFRSFHRGIPFHTKRNQIIFGGRGERGSKYNYTKRRDIEINPRHYLWSDAVPKDNIYCPANSWIDSKTMVDYKYILDIDGWASTWDAMAWKLNSGSVIFKTDSGWRQWYYDEFHPWTHYVPVADDFSDIQERFQWCESHTAECEQMIANCLALFQKTFRFQNTVDYCEQLLVKITNE